MMAIETGKEPKEVKKGYVYVITNPAMPGLVKVGITTKDSPRARIDSLYTTGVPVPFDIAYVLQVADSRKVEFALHTAFASHRTNDRREFFSIDPEQVIAILKLLAEYGAKDVTEEVRGQHSKIDSVSKSAQELLRKKRPNLLFSDLGIQIGEKLKFNRKDFEVEVEVVDDRLVRRLSIGTDDSNNTEGNQVEPQSLSSLTRSLLSIDYDVRAAYYWTYQGRLLSDIYDEKHRLQ